MPKLGRQFFTAAYLTVNQDAGAFALFSGKPYQRGPFARYQRSNLPGQQYINTWKPYKFCSPRTNSKKPRLKNFEKWHNRCCYWRLCCTWTRNYLDLSYQISAETKEHYQRCNSVSSTCFREQKRPSSPRVDCIFSQAGDVGRGDGS
jgi:hypothetical protein